MDRVIHQSGLPIQLNPASLVFFLAAALSARLVVLAWGHRNEPSGPPLISLLVFEASRRPYATRAPVLPPVAFPKPVVQAGLPFVSFQDPRASALSGNRYPYGTALVQPAASR